MERGLRKLVTKRVHIEWKKEFGFSDPWCHYIVRDVDCGFIELQGVADNEGAPYNGGPIWCNMDMIDTIAAEEVGDVTQT